MCLNNQYLPVKVEAALALKELLDHQTAVDFLRPGLSTLLHTYLKVMDEIDFDELIAALQGIVETYQEEIAPFAVDICVKLSQAYVRLIQSNGQGDDEDQETSLSADGIVTAIRHVLISIRSVPNKEQMYQQLEAILQECLTITITQPDNMSVEEGLTCISELLYNQPQISDLMWSYYPIMMDSFINNKGILDEYIPQTAVPVLNYISKNPQQFMQANFFGASASDLVF